MQPTGDEFHPGMHSVLLRSDIYFIKRIVVRPQDVVVVEFSLSSFFTSFQNSKSAFRPIDVPQNNSTSFW